MKTFIVIAVIAVAGWFGWRYWSNREKAPVPTYREVQVERGSIRIDILATALTKPQNRLEINSPVAGRIDEILVREGDTVTNGQILGWVSSTDRATLLDAARARGGEEATRWAAMYKPAPLIAPLSATVISRLMEPGQSASSSDGILVLSDRLIVEASVDETDIRSIHKGQSVSVEFDAYRGKTYTARVDHIAYDADTKNGVTLYAVDVLCEPPPDFLRSAMSANVKFLLTETNDVLILPIAALQRSPQGTEVLRPGANVEEPPLRSKVTTGLDDGRVCEVREGLNEGETVLIQEAILPSSAGAIRNPLIPVPRGGGRPRR